MPPFERSSGSVQNDRKISSILKTSPLPSPHCRLRLTSWGSVEPLRERPTEYGCYSRFWWLGRRSAAVTGEFRLTGHRDHTFSSALIPIAIGAFSEP
eukprot:1195676-Prorocentrum_minimum.AAC.1